MDYTVEFIKSVIEKSNQKECFLYGVDFELFVLEEVYSSNMQYSEKLEMVLKELSLVAMNMHPFFFRVSIVNEESLKDLYQKLKNIKDEKQKFLIFITSVAPVYRKTALEFYKSMTGKPVIYEGDDFEDFNLPEDIPF